MEILFLGAGLFLRLIEVSVGFHAEHVVQVFLVQVRQLD